MAKRVCSISIVFLLLGFVAGVTPLQAQGEAMLEEARAAVAEFRAHGRSKNVHVRRLAVEVLAGTNHLLVTKELLGALKDKDAGVRLAAEKGLEKQSAPAAKAYLVKVLWRGGKIQERVAAGRALCKLRPKTAAAAARELAGAGDWRLREAAARLLGLYPDQKEKNLPALLPLLEDREALVRLAATESTGMLADPRGAQALIARLEDKDWRVQASAIRGLARARLKATIEPLILFMEKHQGRLVEDAGKALATITGFDYPADAGRWREWWSRAKAGFKVPTLAELRRRKEKEENSGYAKPKREVPTYHGIKTRSRRMLFIIDVSASMNDDVVLDESRPRALEEFKARYGEARRKIDIARTEMISMVAQLKPYVRFNIITFASEVRYWKKKLVPASTGNRYSALKFLEKMQPVGLAKASRSMRTSKVSGGQTNSCAALNAAFAISKMDDAEKRSYRTQADTVFFLSDGNPTVGEIVEPGPLLDHVRRLNEKARLVIHTISFGTDNRAFMEPIARMTGGKYVAIGL